MSRGPFLVVGVLAAGLTLSAARGDEARELKPIATARDDSRSARIGSFTLQRAGVVIRGPDDLVALTRKEDAKDPAVRKDLEAELARLLKVEAVDWTKHTVLGVIGDGFESLKVDGKVLTATYVPFKEPLARSIPRTPKTLVLIDRFEGEVKFVPKK
jgi:hypothetical protein